MVGRLRPVEIGRGSHREAVHRKLGGKAGGLGGGERGQRGQLAGGKRGGELAGFLLGEPRKLAVYNLLMLSCLQVRRKEPHRAEQALGIQLSAHMRHHVT